MFLLKIPSKLLHSLISGIDLHILSSCDAVMLYRSAFMNKLKFSYTRDNFCLSQWEFCLRKERARGGSGLENKYFGRAGAAAFVTFYPVCDMRTRTHT